MTTPRAARSTARSWRGGVGLIILCLLVYIPGLWSIPPVDRDESRFAQASRQMLESGTLEGWVVPRVQDKPRLNKPPLIYWLQASSAAILGDAPGQWSWLDGGSENIWVYRVPSLLSAIVTVLLTWRLGVRMFDPRAAWLAAALLAVCPMVVWDAHQARADQLLLATTTATMLALWHVWRPSASLSLRERDVLAKRGRGEGVRRPTSGAVAWPATFWLFLSLGIMTKGPITPMIAALTAVSLSLVSRNWRWLLRLRPILGVLIVAAVVAPWVYLVGNEVGWKNYLTIIYDETIGRSAGAKEGHWGPPGYHIVLLGVLFWPGSLLTAAAIGRAWRRGLHSSPSRDRKGASAPDQACNADTTTEGSPDPQHSVATTPTTGPAPQDRTLAGQSTTPDAPSRSRLRRAWHALRDARPSRPAELFLLAWMLPSWIVFELISTKLPHYTMPLYPAVALLSARAVLSLLDRGHKPRIGHWTWLAIGTLLLIGVGLLVFPQHGFDPTTRLLLMPLGYVVLLVAAWRLALTARLLARHQVFDAQLEAILVAVALLFALNFCALPANVVISRGIQEARARVDHEFQRPLASVTYHEDSLVFLTRGHVQRLNPAQLDEWAARHPNGIVVFPVSLMDSTRTGQWARGNVPKFTIGGFNYSKGQQLHLLLVDLSGGKPE